MTARTDRHNNPAAITVDVAKQAGLLLGVEYEAGDAFPNNPKLRTARLLGDPVPLTIRVIDAIGYYTKSGQLRWTYISLPTFVWAFLSTEIKRGVIGFL